MARCARARESARGGGRAERARKTRVSRVGSWECGTERGRRGRILIDAPRANRGACRSLPSNDDARKDAGTVS